MNDSSLIIFLDIDGVLATNKFIFSSKEDWIKKYACYRFDPRCVDSLNEILNNVEADIVISSDWQKFFTIEELSDIFKINGVNKAPIDITRQKKLKFTSSPAIDRSAAIKNYVIEHENIIKYVVVDDMLMDFAFSWKNFIHCNDTEIGIADNEVKKKIILSLNY